MPVSRIHIGFPKTGSTMLQAYFTDSPHIRYSRKVLDEYVRSGDVVPDDRFVDQDILSEELLSVWSGGDSVTGVEKYSMHFNMKEQQRKVANQLFKYFPNARILIVVRAPESLVQSLYSQSILSGGHVSSKRFLAQSGKHIFEIFDYDFVISLYEELFGSERVLVLPFEFLVQDRNTFLKVIERFFEFPHYEVDVSQVNRSFPSRLIPILRCLSIALKILIRPLPLSVKKKAFNYYSEKLYVAKETWVTRLVGYFQKGQPIRAKDLKRCIDKHYVFCSKLRANEFVLPFLDSYMVGQEFERKA